MLWRLTFHTCPRVREISAEDLRPGAGSDELTALLVIEPVSPTVWRANDD